MDAPTAERIIPLLLLVLVLLLLAWGQEGE